jgi:chorismate synthase
MLERRGVEIFARVAELGGVPDAELDTANPDIERLRTLSKKEFPVLDDLQGEKMLALVEDVRTKGDSVGGVIQCLILGLPAGLGDPIFGGVESRLS